MVEPNLASRYLPSLLYCEERREGKEVGLSDKPVDTGTLEAVEHRQEQVGGHGGAEQVGEVDKDKLCAVTVVLHGDAQQSDGRHEARHQGESHR